MVPKYNQKGPHKTETMSKEDVDVMTEAKCWSDSRKGSQAKESRQPPEIRKGKERDSPLQPPKEPVLSTP